jgi:Cd2+/Zn2+-exporting ATPase
METLIKSIPSEEIHKEEGNKKMQPEQKTIYLLGLGCADCGRKIEKKVSAIEGVTSANLEFVTQKLTITINDEKKLPAIIRQITVIATSVEPDIKVSYTPDKPQEDNRAVFKKRLRIISVTMGALLFFAGVLFELRPAAELALFLAAYLLAGGEIIFEAGRNILKGQVFDENFLMGIATIGAFAIGEYPEAVAVMLFYQVGEAFQRLAVNRSRKSITSLMDIRPDYANLKKGGDLLRVAPEDVGVGQLIVVRPGEKIPLDGRVTEGSSALDMSALTGEAIPRDVSKGDDVLSGSINKNGVLTVEVTKEFGESTVVKILELVSNAASKKAPVENFITKFARYYTPVVVFAAVALAFIPPLVIPGASLSEWIHRALTFLVVSCPCALVISIPLGFFGGIGGASRNGILVKGSSYLDALTNVDTVVFDKTGTLTKGVFNVTKIIGANGWSEQDLLKYAAYAESFSNHPIAQSVLKAYKGEIDTKLISEQEELPGLGIRVKVAGKSVLAGNARLMDEAKISRSHTGDSGSIVHLAIDGGYAGTIVISDEIKPDSKRTVSDLKTLGVAKTVMLTGDSRASGEKVAYELGLDAVYTELLPDQKVKQLEQLDQTKRAKGKLIFVGDGINDAPVLARADVGIAMGAIGSDAAIEAADIVLMTDEPYKLVTAIRIARKTKKIVTQNIVFALGVKAVILILGAFGVATMWEAVFGDVGVAVIAVLNAIRTMRIQQV